MTYTATQLQEVRPVHRSQTYYVLLTPGFPDFISDFWGPRISSLKRGTAAT